MLSIYCLLLFTQFKTAYNWYLWTRWHHAQNIQWWMCAMCFSYSEKHMFISSASLYIYIHLGFSTFCFECFSSISSVPSCRFVVMAQYTKKDEFSSHERDKKMAYYIQIPSASTKDIGVFHKCAPYLYFIYVSKKPHVVSIYLPIMMAEFSWRNLFK